jgi:nitrite reductase (NO-forming)
MEEYMHTLPLKRLSSLAAVLVVISLFLSACASAQAAPQAQTSVQEPVADTGEHAVQEEAGASSQKVTFTLETSLDGGMSYKGLGGDIDGQKNPTLTVNKGDSVQINLINSDGVEHDLSLPDLNIQMKHLLTKGDKDSIVFKAGKAGEFDYFCSLPGHKQAGMWGKLVVIDPEAPAEAAGSSSTGASASSIVHDPTDLPVSVGSRAPQTLRVDLETVEMEGQLADGTTYTYWTFDGTVPGPFLRVRVGDTVELFLKNDAKSTMVHSIDLHAVTGPGGGAAVTQAAPGEEKSFTFQALNPGLYVYHCATPMVAHHIANGMYGLILVEPEGGLPPVDREFYVMQGEIYSQGTFGAQGQQPFSVEKLLAEDPEYFVFNGAAGALAAEKPLQANVGETVRIFFGVGGPNFTSSFHVIGEIFDRVYDQASLTAAPLTDVQTTLVPPGGATMVEFKLEVPGRYILVDHALSRLERGLAGFLIAEGPENPEVFHSDEMPSASSGH